LDRFDARWFGNLKEDEKARLKRELIDNISTLARLYAIVVEEEEKLLASDLSISEYNSPAWPYLKADRLGALRSLHSIRKLLEFTQQKE